MVLPKHIPDEVSADTAEIYRQRFPNYCHECGSALVVAGGQVEARGGWYESLDPVLVCGKDACVRFRMTAGVDQEDGQKYRIAPGAEEHEDLFGAMRGWCDVHRERMVATKDLLLDGQPARQFKCGECDRESVIIHEG